MSVAESRLACANRTPARQRTDRATHDREQTRAAFPSSLQHDQRTPDKEFPSVLARTAASARSIFKQVTRRGFSSAAASMKSKEPQGVHAASGTLSKEETQGVPDCEDGAPIPCRPREPPVPIGGGKSRGNTLSTAHSPLRQISRMLSSGGGSGKRGGSAQPGARPLGSEAEEMDAWKPYQKLSRMLRYRPRIEGRTFTETYDLADTLGSGGFAVVKAGKGNSY